MLCCHGHHGGNQGGPRPFCRSIASAQGLSKVDGEQHIFSFDSSGVRRCAEDHAQPLIDSEETMYLYAQS